MVIKSVFMGFLRCFYGIFIKVVIYSEMFFLEVMDEIVNNNDRIYFFEDFGIIYVFFLLIGV